MLTMTTNISQISLQSSWKPKNKCPENVLEGLSRQIANVDIFVSMYIRKEALLSSQIEGTQTTPDDILDPRAEENANIDVAEDAG